MKKDSEKELAAVLEEVAFILNEIKQTKLKELEKTKLTARQEKIIEDIEKDLDVCATKLGLVLHTAEL